MGCMQSKQAVVEAPTTQRNANGSTPNKAKDHTVLASTPSSNGTTQPADVAASGSLPMLVSRDDWKVRPGYSSGASSYSGSDDDDGSAGRRERLLSEGSKHSNILALDSLRKEMAADGDLAKTVVRIETPFDTPIEQIYDGVLNGCVLGSGASGIVRLVVHRSTGVKYAVKCLDLDLIDTTEGLRQLRNEIFIMCQLDHPNIVRIEEVYESANEIYIVQELCHGGDLFDRLDKQPDYHYTEAQCARLVKQMLSSIRYLHSKGIIHRDLKLENFLFSSIKVDSELKLIDFGLSKHFEIGQMYSDKVGTPYTVAPEIIKGSHDEKSDMWSLGVITYLLLSGETPFGGLDGENPMTVKEKILRAEVKFEPRETWETVSDEGKAFIKRLLNVDPTKRPTAKSMQRCRWIQVYAKKDAKEGGQLNPNTVGALVKFKESSDMQKLLSEVLSFTLLPEQIVELRKEFEKMDSDGDGEISLTSLKSVLMENAADGALGALNEQEVEDIFDSIRVRKHEPTIRWHEFLAAGLSQARVDDRNLRLAFDRMDYQRKGFITFDDLSNILGNSTEYEALEKIWFESLEDVKAHLDRITFHDFKKLMKGQPKDVAIPCNTAPVNLLAGVPEEESVENKQVSKLHGGVEFDGLNPPSGMLDEAMENPRSFYKKKRSQSYEQRASSWDSAEFSNDASLALVLPTQAEYDEITNDPAMSPLMMNRALYRRHRAMRLAVLDASKQFDKKRSDIQDKGEHTRASLIMKRGAMTPVELEDSHARALFELAAIRCGRARKTRNKTCSDVTGMLLRAEEE